MIERTPWFQRIFETRPPKSLMPTLLERLRGTPVRIAERLLGASPEVLTRRHDGSWSIQENVGHLWDLEHLWARRLQDFLRGERTLTEADLQNQKTHDAEHNRRQLYFLVGGFRQARMELVRSLEHLTATDLTRNALHPRLEQPMTIPGMCLFIAEHDDHHMARISELLRLSAVRA